MHRWMVVLGAVLAACGAPEPEPADAAAQAGVASDPCAGAWTDFAEHAGRALCEPGEATPADEGTCLAAREVVGGCGLPADLRAGGERVGARLAPALGRCGGAGEEACRHGAVAVWRALQACGIVDELGPSAMDALLSAMYGACRDAAP